jgi:hypothetical protein
MDGSFIGLNLFQVGLYRRLLKRPPASAQDAPPEKRGKTDESRDDQLKKGVSRTGIDVSKHGTPKI